MAGRRITITFLGDSRSFERAASTVEGRATRMGGVLQRTGGFGRVMAGGLAIAGGAAAAAGGTFLAMGVKTAAANEQAKIAFTTMLGSGRKAQTFLTQLQQFAAKTPFEFPELQTAASSLISAGINAKKVIPIMTTLGDVTSGMGTGAEGVKRATIALQQMNAAGRITGEDLNQLRDAGIPVFDLLAKATGKSKAEIVKLAQAGKLGKRELDQMMKALESGAGLERFSGLMDKQSKSLTGLWSTFKDTMGQNAAKALEPLVPILKDGIGGATTLLANVLPKVTGALANLIKGMQSGTGAGGGIVRVFRALWGAAKVVGDFIGHQMVPFLQDLGRRFMGAAGGTSGLHKMMVQLRPTIEIVKTALGGLWRGLGMAAKVLIPLVVGAFRTMIPIINTIARVVKWLWNAIFQPVMKLIVGAIAGVIEGFGMLLRAIGKLPHMEWATRAADNLHSAALQAKHMSDNIKDIPNHKEVAITYNIRRRYQNNSGIGGADPYAYAPRRAMGGPVRAGQAYVVGERRAEMFVPSQNGRIESRVGAGGDTYIFHISGVIGGEDQLMSKIEQGLAKRRRRTGRPLEFAKP